MRLMATRVYAIPAAVLIAALTAMISTVCSEAEAQQNSSPWIAVARIIKNGEPTFPGVYLRSGLIITAAHVVDPAAKNGVHLAGVALPAEIVKHGSLDDVDLSLLKIDEDRLPARVTLPQMELCTAPPWPGDPVIVVDADRATRSTIVAPQILHLTLRVKFATLIGDVATTGNSGSGVFDPNRKCLHGIMSRKFMSGGKDIAKYFVPASEIRDFIPSEFRNSK